MLEHRLPEQGQGFRARGRVAHEQGLGRHLRVHEHKGDQLAVGRLTQGRPLGSRRQRVLGQGEEERWGCNKGYPDVHKASTIEATDWTTGMRERPAGPTPGCPNAEYRVPVMPNSDYDRGDTSSLTLASAISIGGFTGS